MPKLSLKYISEITRGRLAGSVPKPDRVFANGYVFDTRKLRRGDLFFALRTDKGDGHDFVKDACDRGAVGAVVESAVRGAPPEFPQVVVPSTLEALQMLAADARGHVRIPVVAISGSNGKTTTKEMLTAILSSRMNVHKSPGNFNNHIGVPVSILGLEDSHEVLVVELGSNHRGEIARLAEIATPTIGVLTNVGPAHIGHFGSIDEIAREKTDLLRHLAEGGRGVVNADDDRLQAALDDVTADITTYGVSPGSAFRAVEIETRGVEGSTFVIEGTRMSLRVPGMHNVYNALAAVTAASLMGVSPADAAGPLLDFRPIRMKTISIGEITAIDDTYNANPDSVGAALDTLMGCPAVRRIFVMGVMLELGGESARFHRQAGRKVAGSGIDSLIGIGGDTAEAVAGAIEEGMPGDCVRFFDTKAQAAAFLKQILKPGDVVLLKGSRATGLEEILAYLRQQMVEGRA